MKDVDLGEPTSFLDHVYLGCRERECQISKVFAEICWNPRFLPELWKNNQFPRNRMRMCPHGPMTWKACKEVREKILRVGEQLNSYTRSQHHALTTITSKKKKMGSVGELSQVCSQIVLTCLYLARMGSPDIL